MSGTRVTAFPLIKGLMHVRGPEIRQPSFPSKFISAQGPAEHWTFLPLHLFCHGSKRWRGQTAPTPTQRSSVCMALHIKHNLIPWEMSDFSPHTCRRMFEHHSICNPGPPCRQVLILQFPLQAQTPLSGLGWSKGPTTSQHFLLFLSSYQNLLAAGENLTESFTLSTKW